MKSNFLIIFSLNVLKINVILFLFEMSFKEFISKLSSSDSFLIINLKDYMTTNKIIDKNEKFFDIDILSLSYSHRLKINNILSLSILRTTSYLFIYNFSKIKSCYFN